MRRLPSDVAAIISLIALVVWFVLWATCSPRARANELPRAATDAISTLAPHLGQARARRLAAVTEREARQANLDPLLVIAYVHVESHWRAGLRSRTQDHGLGQIHVSSTTNPELLGQQAALLSPEYNLAVTASMMRMWRDYHDRTCAPMAPFWSLLGRAPHHWISHMKFGYRVKAHPHAGKVLRLYRDLRRLRVI